MRITYRTYKLELTGHTIQFQTSLPCHTSANINE